MAKDILENELMFGMQRELQPYNKKQGMNSLVQAAEYLQAAVEIFEDAGLNAKADQVLHILGKIAIANEQNKDKDFYSKVMTWMDNPGAPIDSENVQSGEELQFTSIVDDDQTPDVIEFSSLIKDEAPSFSDEELRFRSVAAELGLLDSQDAKAKPKNPTKVSDTHTKGLTPEKMVSNLKGHGTMFNMADDGAADDLLNADIGDEPLEVSENELSETFEDGD